MTSANLSAIGNWEERASQSAWSVKALATNCQVSPRTLQRFWKKHRQVPLAEWLEEQRFACACLLLRNPELKIECIARSVAYRHIGAFSHAFSVRFGVPPRMWRESHRLVSPYEATFAVAARCTPETLSQLRKLHILRWPPLTP